MMISKNVQVGSLEIDVNNGKIWLNSPGCILRIQNIRFNNLEEKFSMIDINGSNASMIPGDYPPTDYDCFLEKLNMSMLPKICNMENSEKFLDELYIKIQEFVKETEKCQS